LQEPNWINRHATATDMRVIGIHATGIADDTRSTAIGSSGTAFDWSEIATCRRASTADTREIGGHGVETGTETPRMAVTSCEMPTYARRTLIFP